MIRSHLTALLTTLLLLTGPAMSASLSSDLFEKPGESKDQQDVIKDGSLPDVLRGINLANQNFAEAVDNIEAALRDRASYGPILQLAPQLIENAPSPDRVRWMFALALAATGDLENAQAVISEIANPEERSPTAYLAQAMLLQRQGETEEATELAREAILLQPSYAYAYNLMGTLKAELGQTEEAIEWVSQATVYSGTSAVFWRNLGILQFRQDRITDAAKALEKALIIAPNDCIALMASAQLYDAAEQPDTAREFVNRCIEDGTGDRSAAVQYLLSQTFARNDFSEALTLLDTHADVVENEDLIRAEVALQMNTPDLALPLLDSLPASRARDVRKVYALAMQGRVDEALEVLSGVPVPASEDAIASAFLEVALTVAAGREPRSFALGMANRNSTLGKAVAWYTALHKAQDNAVGASRTVLQANEMLTGVRFQGVPVSDWTALRDDALRQHMALGVLWTLRDYKEASVQAFDAVNTQANVQQAAYFTALADFQRGDLDAARDRLAPVADANPAFFSAQVLMAEIQLRYARFDLALIHYQNAAQVLEESSVLLRVGVLADMEDKPEAAETALRGFIRANPESFVGYNQLAWVFIQREMRLDEALELAQKAESLQPGNASVLDNIGWVLFLQGDAAAAVEKLRLANTNSGNANPDILYHLAAVEADLGATGVAKGLLQRLFRAAPDDHPAVIAGRELETQLN